MAETKAKKKDYPQRTFVKKQPDGTELTRVVTGPSTEVAARYDGFVEQASTKTSSGSTSSAKPNSPS